MASSGATGALRRVELAGSHPAPIEILLYGVERRWRWFAPGSQEIDMTKRTYLGIGLATLLLASGCHRGAQVKAVQLTEPGTYVVATPGALSVAQKSANVQRICTMRTPRGKGGHGKGAHGKSGMHSNAGKHGKRRRGKGGRGWGGPGGRGHGGPGGRGGSAGGAVMLDTLMYRLCEARSNGDITSAQYQELLKAMMEMAKHRAMAPPPHFGPRGMRPGRGRMGRPGMGPRRGRPGMGPGAGPWGGPGGDWGKMDDAPDTPKDKPGPKKPGGKGKAK